MMERPDLLLLGPYNDPEMEMLAKHFTLHRLWDSEDPEALMTRLAPSLRAIGSKGELGASASLINRFPALEIVSVYGVGTDAVDLPHARGRGIQITNTPDVLSEDVADMAWALLLAAARRIPAGDVHVRSGTWSREAFPMVRRVHGKRLGVVGLGRIGRAVARRGEGFGMQIGYSGRTPRSDVPYNFHPDPASLAAVSDILVVCAAGGTETQGLVGKEAHRALGPAGLLVNVSRGSVVDETALLEALESGVLGAAGLDVFLNEPTPDARFAKLLNVILQPHASSGTHETWMAMAELVRDNLLAHFSGRPLPTPVS